MFDFEGPARQGNGKISSAEPVEVSSYLSVRPNERGLVSISKLLLDKTVAGAGLAVFSR